MLLILVADITVSVAVSALVVDEFLVRRLIIMLSTFAHIYDETIVFSIGIMVFFGRLRGYGSLVGNLHFKLDWIR